jgi:hypothetical protein
MADVVARAQAFRDAGVDYLSLGIDAPDRATLMAIVAQLADDLIPAVA